MAGGGAIDRPYTYSVGSGLQPQVGQCVIVPLGTGNREELAYVLSLTENPIIPEDLEPAGKPDRDPESGIFQIKPIRAVLDIPPVFDRATASLFCWMAREYLCSLPDALRCVIPTVRIASIRTSVRLSGDLTTRGMRKPSPLAAKVLELLSNAGGEVDLTKIQEAVHSRQLTAAMRQLVKRGQLEIIRSTRQPVEHRLVNCIQLAANAEEIETWLQEKSARRPRQAAVLRAVQELSGEPIAQAELLRRVNCTPSPIKQLLAQGLLRTVAVPLRRNPWPASPQIPLTFSLTPHQSTALETILAGVEEAANQATGLSGVIGPDSPATSSTLLHAPPPACVLLRGVTGSGKTEVYLHAIEETQRRGRQSIALVPEIALTAQMIGIYQARFGSRVAVLHSKLSDGERLDEWQRIYRGDVDVVIGARSALFAPTPNLGLIVLDEEHESSYKQDSDPRYVARDAAMERARLVGACVLLGSATPSLEAAWLVDQKRSQLAVLPARIDDRPMPVVDLVDQRVELKENPGHLFSRKLTNAIHERLKRGEQTILFLNRRGFATITLCRDCGYVAHCKNCDVALTYYISSRMLRCHHCQYAVPGPDVCPQCSGANIRQFGIGTEKVEDELVTLCPSARIARLDTDSTSRKGSGQDIVDRFRSGCIDILVGTQMVAKGFDFPNVTLVGVISADTMLNIPDFRAAERTFQLLTQVSGRAGRGDRIGQVIVQTFNPEHYSIRAAARHDWEEFRSLEMPFREEAVYPPFVSLASILATGMDRKLTKDLAEKAGRWLRGPGALESVTVLGPSPAPLSRIKGLYRWHLLLKARDPQVLRTVCRTLRSQLGPSDDSPRLSIDLDPMTLL